MALACRGRRWQRFVRARLATHYASVNSLFRYCFGRGAETRAHNAYAIRVFRAALDDGTPLLFRLIQPSDKGLLLEAFQRLSDQSRYLRFFRHLSHLSEQQLRYLTEVDHHNHSAWIAITETVPARGVGVARWIRLPEDETTAEVAVTVVDEFQRRGVGRTLLYLAATTAFDKGVRYFHAWVLAENRATLQMLESLSPVRRAWEQGVLELTVPLEVAVREGRDLVPLELLTATDSPR